MCDKADAKLALLARHAVLLERELGLALAYEVKKVLLIDADLFYVLSLVLVDDPVCCTQISSGQSLDQAFFDQVKLKRVFEEEARSRKELIFAQIIG